jgi:hypothetical protein
VLGGREITDVVERESRPHDREPVDLENRQSARNSVLDARALCRALDCQPGDILVFDPTGTERDVGD